MIPRVRADAVSPRARTGPGRCPSLSRRIHRHPACYGRLLAAGTPKKLALTACMRERLPIPTAMMRTNTTWQHSAEATAGLSRQLLSSCRDCRMSSTRFTPASRMACAGGAEPSVWHSGISDGQAWRSESDGPAVPARGEPPAVCPPTTAPRTESIVRCRSGRSPSHRATAEVRRRRSGRLAPDRQG